MSKRSEGIRRITLGCSIAATLIFVTYVVGETGGFQRKMGGTTDWLIFIGGIPVTFYTPYVISKIIYWIKGGFSQDKNT